MGGKRDRKKKEEDNLPWIKDGKWKGGKKKGKEKERKYPLRIGNNISLPLAARKKKDKKIPKRKERERKKKRTRIFSSKKKKVHLKKKKKVEAKATTSLHDRGVTL